MNVSRVLTLAGGVTTFTVAGWAASPPLRFDHRAATLPPLSLAEITRQPGPALTLAPERSAARLSPPRSNPRDRVRSDPRWPMPVIKPGDGVDYKMVMIPPDPAVDYKMEMKSPDADATAATR